MNKKIILNSIIILAQTLICYGGGLAPIGISSISKSVHTAIAPIMVNMTANMSSKAQGSIGSGSTMTSPTIIGPRAKLTPQQMNVFTESLARRGGRDYFPQLQKIWELYPEMFYSALDALQAGQMERAREYFDQIMKNAKEMTKQTPAKFNVQDAITHNKALDTLVNEDLSTELKLVSKNMSTLAYDGKILANETEATRKLFYDLQEEVASINKQASDIVSNTTLTPQQAASKLRELISKIQEVKRESETISIGSRNKEFQNTLSEVSENLESIETILEKTQTILQKTASIQEASVPLSKLSQLANEITSSTELPAASTPSSLEPTSMPNSISSSSTSNQLTPIIQKEVSVMAQNITNTELAVKTLNTAISDINASLDQQALVNLKNVLNLSRVHLEKNLQVLHLLSKNMLTVSTQPNQLVNLRKTTAEIAIAINQIQGYITTIKEQTKNLLTSEQQKILEPLHTIVKELMEIYTSAEKALFVAEKIDAVAKFTTENKDLLELKSFAIKTFNDAMIIDKSSTELSSILKSNSELLKTDKAPVSMLKVFDSAFTNYITTFKQINNIQKLEDIASLQEMLESQQKDVLTALNSLFSKIAWLPTSPAKNNALRAFAALKSNCLKTIDSVNATLKEAGLKQEIHTFINIEKAELGIALAIELEKSKAFEMLLVKKFKMDNMSSQQAKALQDLQKAIQENIQAVKQLQTSNTTFEIDQLIQEYFRKSQYELTIPFGKSLAIPLGKPYFKDSSIVPYKGLNSLTIIPKLDETLKNALKLFGLKIVLGLSALGVLEWTLEKISAEEESNNTPQSDVISPMIEKIVMQKIQEPKTIEEFTQAAKTIEEDVTKLNEIPDAQLAKAVHRLEMDIDILNLNKFKKQAIAFYDTISKSIASLIAQAKANFNYHRVKILEELNSWYEKHCEPLLQDVPSKNGPNISEQDFDIQYQHAIDALEASVSKWEITNK